MTECFQKGFDSRLTVEEDGWVLETRRWEIGRGCVCLCVWLCMSQNQYAYLCVCAGGRGGHLLNDRHFRPSDFGKKS